MSFLFPVLLIFGVLAIVPFIIHLFGERKYKPLSFSSLKFLREIERESMQKFHLRQWLILISRALWILMIVLLLAQPYFKNAGGSLNTGVLVVDRSYSTQIDPKYNDAVEDILATFKSWPSYSYSSETSVDSLLASVKQYCLKSKAKDNIIFITDAQNNTSNLSIKNALRKMNEQLYVLPIYKTKLNTAILDVSESLNLNKNSNLRHLQVLLSGDGSDTKLSADIFVNSKFVGRAYEDDTHQADYYYSNAEQGELLCVAKCAEDNYPEDNARYLVLPETNDVKILFVDHAQSTSYAAQAFRSINALDIEEISPDQIAMQNLNNYDMIWLNQLPEVNQGIHGVLLDYAKDHPLLLSASIDASNMNIWKNYTGNLKLIESSRGHMIFYDRLNSNSGFKVRKYYTTDLKAEEVMWKLDSGEPLLLKQKDNMFVLLSPLYFEWNEMGLSPYFLRTLYSFIQASLRTKNIAYEIDDMILLGKGYAEIVTPHGEHIRVREEFKNTQEAGFYSIEQDDQQWTIAVNIPREECEQSRLDISQSELLEIQDSDVGTIENQIRGRKGQTLFFVLAMLFIIIEMALIRRGESTE